MQSLSIFLKSIFNYNHRLNYKDLLIDNVVRVSNHIISKYLYLGLCVKIRLKKLIQIKQF